jgi:hypothetical protein
MKAQLGTKEFNDLAMEMFGGKPKQETILGKTVSKKDADKDSFEDVTNYKKERSYSEEDMIAFGEFIFKHSLLTHTKGVKSLFEQFKNK